MSQDIAFVANFHMTETFLSVAKRLEAEGTRVHWFAFSRRWARWLAQSGVPHSRIALLGRGQRAWMSGKGPGLSPAASLEPGEPTPLEAIEADRVLRQRPLAQTIPMLQRLVEEFRHEAMTRKLCAVFGEATWAVELLLAYTARDVGITYLSPCAVRYPTGRFGFFRAPLQAELLDLQGDHPDATELAEEVYSVLAPLDEGGKRLWPENEVSMDRFVRQPRLMAEKLWLSFQDSARNPTQMNLVQYLRTKNPIGLRKSTHAARRATGAGMRLPSELGEPYVLMPLQVQPEASVDVLSWRSRDQALNVRRVAQSLDPSVLVGVKEHSHDFGSRPGEFYHELLSMPNVFLIDPSADSRIWMRSAAAVVAPTGTMAYENALLGGHSYVASNMYFNALPTVHLLNEQMNNVAVFQEPLPMDKARAVGVAFLEGIVNKSWPGMLADPRSTPWVLEKDNLDCLAAGFGRCLEVLPR